jgi:ribosomal protein S18 acetylase RimI-like enzyme
MITIFELTKEYNSIQIIFEYTTRGHFKAFLTNHECKFGVEFIYEDFKKEVKKSFTDTLVPDYLEFPKSFGARIGDDVVGYAVVNHEPYHNRVRIAQLLVLNEYRTLGVGKMLMQHAEDYAKSIKARALILETQSCNIPAIRFYQSCGFQFVGCDVTCYTNNDVENNEVRLELGKSI